MAEQKSSPKSSNAANLITLFGLVLTGVAGFFIARLGIQDKINKVNVKLINRIAAVEGDQLLIRQAIKQPEKYEKKLRDWVKAELPKALKNQEIHYDSLPVGTIVPFMGTKQQIPSGWVVCDGETHIPSDSRLSDMITKVPDLQGRFLRGASTDEKLGKTDGVDHFDARSIIRSGKHHHSYSGTTGTISSGGQPLQHTPYSIVDEGAGFTQDRMISVQNGHSSKEGHHRHDLRITTPDAGEHYHSLPSETNLPPYCVVYFIMRVQ